MRYGIVGRRSPIPTSRMQGGGGVFLLHAGSGVSSMPSSWMKRLRELTPAYGWSARAGRYRDLATGRFVSFRAVREALDAVVDSSAERLGSLAEKLITGELGLGDWTREMAMEVKRAHLAAVASAKGGWAQLTPADLGRVGAELKKQYGYLRRFATEIADGKQAPNGRVIVRAKMYAQSARKTYEESRRQIQGARGITQERRVRHALESCQDCIEYEALGWQPLGTLPPIGDSRCRMNCRCTFEYR